jgi:hypothetical protein
VAEFDHQIFMAPRTRSRAEGFLYETESIHGNASPCQYLRKHYGDCGGRALRAGQKDGRLGPGLDEIIGTPDKGIPEDLLDSAERVAVIPLMIKIGFVFGGRYPRKEKSFPVSDS